MDDTGWVDEQRLLGGTAVDDAIDRIEAAVRRRVEAGDPNTVAMGNRTGGHERDDRRRRWWTDHPDRFEAALR